MEKINVKEYVKQTSLYQMLITCKDLIFKNHRRKTKKSTQQASSVTKKGANNIGIKFDDKNL